MTKYSLRCERRLFRLNLNYKKRNYVYNIFKDFLYVKIFISELYNVYVMLTVYGRTDSI